MAKFLSIRHTVKKEFPDGGSKTLSFYLGDVQIDNPNITRFYSKNTSEIVTVEVGIDGTVTKKAEKANKKKSHDTVESIAVIGR